MFILVEWFQLTFSCTTAAKKSSNPSNSPSSLSSVLCIRCYSRISGSEPLVFIFTTASLPGAFCNIALSVRPVLKVYCLGISPCSAVQTVRSLWGEVAIPGLYKADLTLKRMLCAWGPKVCPWRLAYTVQSVKALWGRFGILCWVKLSWLRVHLIPTFHLDGEGGRSEAKQRKSSPKWNERGFFQGRRKQKRHISPSAFRRFGKSCILFWFVYVTGDAASCHCLQMLFRYEAPSRIRSPPTCLLAFISACLTAKRSESPQFALPSD